MVLAAVTVEVTPLEGTTSRRAVPLTLLFGSTICARPSRTFLNGVSCSLYFERLSADPLLVTARIDQPVTLELIRALAHFLWQLGAQGINLGPHLRLVAVHRDDREAWLAPHFIRLGDNPPTVRTLFGMGTARGYYDTNIEASKFSNSYSP